MKRITAIAGAAIAVLVIALLVGGGAPEPPAPGLQDPGPVTGWGIPVMRVVMDLSAAGAIGSILFAVLWPGDRGVLRKPAVRALRSGSVLAWIWAGSATAGLLLTVSDFMGLPPHRTDYAQYLSMFIADTTEGRAYAVVTVLAVVVAGVSRQVRTLNGAGLLLVLGIATALPPALAGHSASSADHDLATSSLVVHVVVVLLWVGGLFGLARYGRGAEEPAALSVAARRFSGIALWCYVLAGLSGVVNALVRLGAIAELTGSRYGWLVIGKVGFLVALGGFGYWHRRRTLPDLDRRKPGAFARFAGGEALVMAGTIGLAVALSRTAPPVPENLYEGVDSAEALIGFEVPPFDWGNLLTLWRPDTLLLSFASLAGIGYFLGLRRLRARGIGWPIGRTVAWFAGIAVGLLVTVSGMATYAPAMFSVHMVQHMTLSMAVPILLALGAPITLALRALPARPETPGVEGDRTLRGWILEALHSRPARLLTHPLVALSLYVVSLYAFYFSPLLEWAMRSHTGHMVMIVHFTLVGSLYFWPIIGLDPMPRKLAPPGRMALLFASLPFHAFFGVIVMMSATVFGAGWYSLLNLAWLDPLADQNIGGGIAWGAGEIPVLVVVIVVFVAWYRSDTREAKRADRHGDAELAEYNRMLGHLAERD